MNTSVPVPHRRIGLALGGGGARGLAHIIVLEALDELGIRPSRITGTSIGAIYGAGAAAGLTGKRMRDHTEEVLGGRAGLVRQLFSARAEPVTRLLNLLPIRTSLFNPESLMGLLLPPDVPKSFEDLATPLSVVATDFYAQEQVVVTSGPLHRAVAASMALPAIFSPVLIEGRAMVDGGLVNPLPFDLLLGTVDVVIAVDVSGGPPVTTANAAPSPIEVLTTASQIFQRSIVREKLAASQPDVYIDCPVDDFSVLDFHRFRDVLAAAAPVKERLKRELSLVLASTTAAAEATTGDPAPRGRLKERLGAIKLALPRTFRRKPPSES